MRPDYAYVINSIIPWAVAYLVFSNFIILGALRNASESIFDYSVTNGSYLLYNNHSTPRFLKELAGNLTALFSNSSTEEIAQYNQTCTGNNECLLTIARTGNIHEGELIMAAYRIEQYIRELSGKVSNSLQLRVQRDKS